MAATRGTDCRVTTRPSIPIIPRERESPMVDFTDAQKQWLHWLRELGIETADATPELVGASASVRGEPTPPDRPEPKAGTQSDASTSGGETTPKMSVPLSENVVGGPGGGPSDGSG